MAETSTATPPKRGVRGLAVQANPTYALAVVLVPIGALMVAIGTNDLRLLGYVHVMAGVIWTGIDLFMGAVIGPVVGSLEPEQRAGFFKTFTPKMTFLMPVLSLVTIAGGIVFALRMGKFPHADPWLALMTAAHLPIIPIVARQYNALTDRRTLAIAGLAIVGTGAFLARTLPAFAMTDPWIVAALAIATLLTTIGVGVLLPGEINIYLEIISPSPDVDRIGRIGLRNAKLAGVQGLLQLSIIYVMVNLRF